MFKNLIGGIKRAAALLMSLLILASQLMLPVTALAQDASALPAVNLYYMAGEEQRSISIWPSLYGDQPVYWATLPGEAMGVDVTLEIAPTGVEGETYNSTYGYQFFSSDASAVDDSYITHIEVYMDGGLLGSYPLYLSTLPLPEVEEEDEPIVYDPQPVTVFYNEQDGSYVSDYTEYVGMEGFTFDPYARVPDGYTLLSTEAVYVTLDENGNLTQSTVEFLVEKEQVYYDPQPVTVYYYDQDGNYVSEHTEYVGMEGYTFDPYHWLPEGYDLLSTESV